MYHLASKIKVQIVDELPLVARYIAQNKLDNVQRVDAALDYLLSHVKGSLDIEKFEEACGVGIVVSPEEIEASVEELIKSHEKEICEKRYHLFYYSVAATYLMIQYKVIELTHRLTYSRKVLLILTETHFECLLKKCNYQ